MKEDDWSALIYSVQQNNCILMLGPDLITEKVNGLETPIVKKLANSLADKLEDKQKILNTDNLLHVAQQYLNQKGRNALQAQVVSFYKAQLKNQKCEILTNLAELPFYFIVYSTPDNFLTEAFKQNKKDVVCDWYNYRGQKRDIVKMGTVEKPLIYHFYGSIQEPESLVLSENELLDFIVNVVSKNPPVPDNIRSEFTNKDKCFLFLGFGFQHWYLRVIMRVLLYGDYRESYSIALEQIDLPDPQNFKETILFFRQRFKINIYKENLCQFVENLKKRYEDVQKTLDKKSAVKKELPPDAPVVFLCHSKENKESAAEFYRRFENNGLKPWLDEENIYGGDDWNKRLEKTITKGIDYFVVLQSKAMEKKFRSYFVKEINLALEIQKQFKPGIRFIIPAKIEECKLLEDLEHLQTIDLIDPDRIDELVRIINRDYQRRKRG